MPQDDGLQARVEELAKRLSAVEGRLAELEGKPGAAAADPLVSQPVPAAGPATAPIPVGLVPLLGRTLVVLGGGYLLRAAADTGALPVVAAALAGLVYAAAWLARADREGANPARRASATFHGLAALAIALPLVLENTLRFRAFTPAAGTLALVLAAAAGIAVGWRRELAVLRWAGALIGVASALVLLIGARDPLPVAFGLLGFAGTLEAVTGARHGGLRWPAATGADLAVLACLALATRSGGPPESYASMPLPLVAAAALLLPLVYVGSAAWRTLASVSRPGLFELLQTPASLLIGLAGAASALAAGAIATQPIGATALILGLGCYLAAFSVIDRRSGQTQTFYAYTSLGGVLTAVGCLWLARGGALTFLLATLGLAGVALALRSGRRTLGAHGALFLVGACWAGGLFSLARQGLLSPAGFTSPALGIAAAGALAACLAGYVALVRGAAALPGGGVWSRLALAAALAWSSAGIVAVLLATLHASAAGEPPGAAAVATARTAVLSALAVALAALARRTRARELAYLVPAVLVGTGLKLLLEDFRFGRPASLFLTLALYGGALIATSRLGRTDE